MGRSLKIRAVTWGPIKTANTLSLLSHIIALSATQAWLVMYVCVTHRRVSFSTLLGFIPHSNSIVLQTFLKFHIRHSSFDSVSFNLVYLVRERLKISQILISESYCNGEISNFCFSPYFLMMYRLYFLCRVANFLLKDHVFLPRE